MTLSRNSMAAGSFPADGVVERIWGNGAAGFRAALRTCPGPCGRLPRKRQRQVCGRHRVWQWTLRDTLAAMGYTWTAVESAPTGIARIRAAAERAALPVRVVAGDFFCARPRDARVRPGPELRATRGSAARDARGRARRLRELDSSRGRNIIKYCLEIEGRGQLVPDGMVPEFYQRHGWRQVCVRENRNMKPSRAGIVLRTAWL